MIRRENIEANRVWRLRFVIKKLFVMLESSQVQSSPVQAKPKSTWWGTLRVETVG